MTKIRNEFHQTETFMAVNVENRTVEAKEVDQVATILCGMSGCTCHSVPIVGESVIDINDNTWRIK